MERTYRYQQEIQAMMYTFGDVRNPLPETTELVEDIVHSQIIEIMVQASQIAYKKGSKNVSPDDLIFLLRHDSAKVSRLREFLSWKDVRKNVKTEENEVPDEEDEKETKLKRRKVKFPWELSGYFIDWEDGDSDDEETNPAFQESIKRLKEADILTKNMSKDEYIEYSECRQASFTYKRAKKFKDWLNLQAYTDMKPNDDLIDILGFMAWDIVCRITETSLNIKKQYEKNEEEPVQDNSKWGLFGSSVDQKPITKVHIHESFRRLQVRPKNLKNFRSGLMDFDFVNVLLSSSSNNLPRIIAVESENNIEYLLSADWNIEHVDLIPFILEPEFNQFCFDSTTPTVYLISDLHAFESFHFIQIMKCLKSSAVNYNNVVLVHVPSIISKEYYKSGIISYTLKISLNREEKISVFTEGLGGLEDSQLKVALDLSSGYTKKQLLSFINWIKYYNQKNVSFIEAAVLSSKKFTRNHTFDIMEGHCTWNDIVGYASTIEDLKKSLYWPIEKQKEFERFGLERPQGVLLHGPSGCGKSFMVNAIASERKLKVLGLKGPEMFSKYFGESERIIRQVFKSARSMAPCILFIEELDVFAKKRGSDDSEGISDRILSCFLNELDGIEDRKGIILLATTNKKHLIDEAILRPGRFDHHILVDKPALDDRILLFSKYLGSEGGMMAELTEGFSCKEISSLFLEISMYARMDKNFDQIIMLKELIQSRKKIREECDSF